MSFLYLHKCIITYQTFKQSLKYWLETPPPSDDTFTKLENRFCSITRGDVYNSFEEAKNACKKDDDCVAIEDYLCDNAGAMNLCSAISDSPSQFHCVYKKG